MSDRGAKPPAGGQAQRVIKRMKDRGVLMGRIGEFGNRLEIRPPLPIAREHADWLSGALHELLAGL